MLKDLKKMKRLGFPLERVSLKKAGAAADPNDILETENRWTDMRKHPHTHEPPIRIRTVGFTGHLTITNPTEFQQLVRNGIGPAKAFGHGLMLIGRA